MSRAAPVALALSFWWAGTSKEETLPISWFRTYAFPYSARLERVRCSLASLPVSETGSWIRWGVNVAR